MMEGSRERSAEEWIRQRDDGRNIDAAVGALSGEGSQQETRAPGSTAPAETFSSVPSIWEGRQFEPTYYGRPAIKSPVWIWTIPAYFFVGGLAGAAMVLGSAAQVLGGTRMRLFAQRCHWTGATAGGIGSALLIADLGRPGRFLNMLRVFRPASPMSVGSWVLAAATPCSLGAALFYRHRGLLGNLGELGGYGAGVLGIPLAGYTGVLLANTAIPVWQQSRRSLPVLFMGSSMASAASILNLVPLPPGADDVVHTFGVAGSVIELAAGRAMEREASRVKQVGKPLSQGAAGMLWTTAKVLTAASLVASVLPGQSRRKRRLSGMLGVLGSLCLRFAVFHAGQVSSRDPHATFRQQRAGLGAAEVTGEPAVTGPERRPVPAPKTKEEIWDARAGAFGGASEQE
jgi:formate-dependent nitrite reductase membrane component NrfD